ncbi:uncharacterized protein [Spinacia oleracea]|uniref:Uncharacterized protein isoform X2 n=1 Tax=Spinacia oleracea TaxID=3562 RepID=A0A9R0K733_SPIOL|nr:uncharacterized protein LOC110799958 isoform X2 [Spinacia oleracea]
MNNGSLFISLCSSPLFSASFPTNNLHGRASRRALSTHLIQHESEAVKVLDATKRSPHQVAYRREEPVKSGIDGDEGEDELVYHIDYHGVTTHPGSNPKHGKP